MTISVPEPASDSRQQKIPPQAPIAAQSDTDTSLSDTFHIDSDPNVISDTKMHNPQHSLRADTLMSPPSIITKSNDSPSRPSSVTPRKRSFAESLELPLSTSLATIGNPAVEEYLLCQLNEHIREGLVTPQGVLRVLENLKVESMPTVPESEPQLVNGIFPFFSLYIKVNNRNFESEGIAVGCTGGRGANGRCPVFRECDNRA